MHKIKESLQSENLVLFNGNIRTMSPGLPLASAIAFVGNRIFAVGSDQEIKSLNIPNQKLIDLQGSRLTATQLLVHATTL